MSETRPKYGEDDFAPDKQPLDQSEPKVENVEDPYWDMFTADEARKVSDDRKEWHRTIHGILHRIELSAYNGLDSIFLERPRKGVVDELLRMGYRLSEDAFENKIVQW